MAKLVVGGVPCAAAEAVILGIPAWVVPGDAEVALKAARLAAQGKPLGLALGDRICLATAQVHGGRVLTTEQAWRGLVLEGAEIEVIREPRPATRSGKKPRPGS